MPCAEDGRHFRPNHHARAAADIEAALTALECENNAWIVRKILPWLPSHSDQFCRREPLTRIRDIAHRNDIPKDLKREIKHQLQNKLHRCAGPEDLKTSEDILARITQPGSDYSPAFVEQFQIFHQELSEFFNATGVDQRIIELQPSLSAADAECTRRFLDRKAVAGRSLEARRDLLERLTVLRQTLAKYRETLTDAARQRLRLADIALEDYAFVLASELANELDRVAPSERWPDVLSVLGYLVATIRLSQIEPQECAAIESELARWSETFEPQNDFHLRRLLATLERAQRIGESYSDNVVGVFTDRVGLLGAALGVPQHAIDMFCEGDIRGNVVFQLSKVVDMVRAALRTALKLPPWEALVAGEAHGRLVQVRELGLMAVRAEPVVVLIEHADGDEEIPRQVRGILLAHPVPHLSHLGVRARQARVSFASAGARQQLEPFQKMIGSWVKLSVGAEELTLTPAEQDARPSERMSEAGSSPLTAILATELKSVPVAAAEATTCGAKAAAAGRLQALADESDLFRAPRGRVLPFGIMEACLSLNPVLEARYQQLQQAFVEASSNDEEKYLGELRELLKTVPIPDDLLSQFGELLANGRRLAVRSSANGEDLEDFAGAGLYESVIGVCRDDLADAVRTVWASLWTRRAAFSRRTCGISHEQIRMAVLIQEMVPPELSFIMHTADPVTGSRDRGAVELALGLGETLASAVQPGGPYRLLCDRVSRKVQLTRLASFSFALHPGSPPPRRERLDYSHVKWSVEAPAGEQLGVRLIDIAAFLETRFGSPQDVEGVIANEVVYLVQSRPQQGLS